jgi:hypothetical protein
MAITPRLNMGSWAYVVRPLIEPAILEKQVIVAGQTLTQAGTHFGPPMR